ncbi:retron system putative HNH endonuclease [Methanoculleus sp.]|uniref:retron system putative HNH endonuclease n=1 Tax=Methanoculleus sp. TaxID=90427 RepID=UPI002FC7BFFA
MRYIAKHDEPKKFRDWKALANEDWKPSFDILQNPEKTVLKESLLDEQGYICCYCETYIDVDTCHIEHFCPQSSSQSRSRALDIDYNNMHCSCDGTDENESKKIIGLHCGKKKDDDFFKGLISPLSKECQNRFIYPPTGEIGPADDEDIAAKRTIELLALDLPKLRSLRKAAIDAFLDPQIDDDEFIAFLHLSLQRNTERKFTPFISTIEYTFREFVHSPASHPPRE